MLTYHQTTFEMVEREQEFDKDLALRVEECEEIFGFSFPMAIREWYSLANSRQILEEFSNDDQPLSLEDLKNAHHQLRSYSHFALNLAEQRMLPFLWENQAVFLCAIKLDDTDDPAVFLWDDDNKWKLADKHFSTGISHWVWNFLYFRLYSDTTLRAEDRMLRQSDLDFLLENFIEVPRKTTSSTIHHFHRHDQHIHIWNENDQISRWWLRAETRESLLNLTQTVWQCGTLTKTLKTQGGHKHNDAGKVLEILRFGKE